VALDQPSQYRRRLLRRSFSRVEHRPTYHVEGSCSYDGDHDVDHEYHDVDHEYHDVDHEYHDVDHEYHDVDHEYHDVDHEYHDANHEHHDANHEHHIVNGRRWFTVGLSVALVAGFLNGSNS
jgi:hypothetical protein